MHNSPCTRRWWARCLAATAAAACGVLLVLGAGSATARAHDCVIYYYKVGGRITLLSTGHYADAYGDVTDATVKGTEDLQPALSEGQYAIYQGGHCAPTWQFRLDGNRVDLTWTSTSSAGPCSGSAADALDVRLNSTTQGTVGTGDFTTGQISNAVTCPSETGEPGDGDLTFASLLVSGPETRITFPANPVRHDVMTITATGNHTDSNGATYQITVTADIVMKRLRDKCTATTFSTCGLPPR